MRFASFPFPAFLNEEMCLDWSFGVADSLGNYGEQNPLYITCVRPVT